MMQNISMYKRCIPFMVIILLMHTSLFFPLSCSEPQTTSLLEEVLDQQQESDSYELSIHSHVTLAQSFIPQKNPLTRVEVKIQKPRVTHQGLTLAFRDDLNGTDLVQKTIQGEDVPFFTNWIEFDIATLEVTVGTTYYIILSSGTPSEAPYRWKYEYNDSGDIYPGGELFRFFETSDIWEKVGTETEFVDACFRTYSYVPSVDMVCSDLFYINESAWLNATPGQENLGAYFTIQNSGTPYSTLDWKIVNWPSWGDWTFSMMNGSDLRPEDGYERVDILISAPNINVPDVYEGKIMVKNVHNENDTAEIYAKLETPKMKQKPHSWFSEYPFFTSFFLTFLKKDFSLFSFLLERFAW